MKEECLICKAHMEYLTQDEPMECAICHKQEQSKTRCVNGHYVCSECHTAGIDSIFGLCLVEDSCNPIAILEKMMSMPFCHMHGPEHHVIVGAALLTAYKNAGARRCLRFLGCLRRGNQRRDLYFHCYQRHAPRGGGLGTEQSHDRKGAGKHRNHRRSSLLQAGFVPVHTCGH